MKAIETGGYNMSVFMAEGITLTPVWVLGVITGSGAVIAFLFKLLIASKDREIDRIAEDFKQLKDQMMKDELRRDKEDAHVKLLIDEAVRLKVNRDHDTSYTTKPST